MIGIILAGGKATRLGPLAAQLNKSLVTVGQKPMLVRQAQQLLKLGCGEIIVVVSPGAVDQVRGVIERAGLPSTETVTQPRSDGPADAVRCALATRRPEQEVVIMTADTLLADDDLLTEPNTCAVAEPPTYNRVWCVHTSDGWEDCHPVPDSRALVAIGHYRFQSLNGVRTACFAQPRGVDGQFQLSDMMNVYADETGWRVLAALKRSWQDVGDVPALARANRHHFIARGFNGIEMVRPGVLKKTGNGKLIAEMNFLMDPPDGSEHLFPRVFHAAGGEKPYYEMEYIDSPSLAELWLYWPAQPEMWTHVATELVDQLRTYLWTKAEYNMHRDWLGDNIEARAQAIWVDKLLERWPGGNELVSHVAAESQRILVPTAHDYAGCVHGDPMFANVLWSLKTGSFKLLDPRGDWGGPGPLGDTRYDIAKIAFSPIIVPIMHGLDGPLKNRRPEARALLEPLWQIVPRDHLSLMCANLLLASAPLHSALEQPKMFEKAKKLMDQR